MARTNKQALWQTVRASYLRDGFSTREAARMTDRWFEWRDRQAAEQIPSLAEPDQETQHLLSESNPSYRRTL